MTCHSSSVLLTLAAAAHLVAAGCSVTTTSDAPDAIAPHWAELIGGAGYQEPSAVAVGPEGQIAVVGNFAGALSHDSAQLSGDGSVDGFLLVFDAAGELRWSAGLVGAGNDSLGSVVFVGDAIVVGGSASDSAVLAESPVAGPASASALLARFAADGSLEWQRTFGGNGYQGVSAVSATPAGTIVVAGDFTSRLELDGDLESAGASDSFVAELSDTGDLLWGTTISSEGTEVVRGVTVGADGSTIVSGITQAFHDAAAEDTHGGAHNASVEAFVHAFAAGGAPLWSAHDLFAAAHSHGDHTAVEEAQILSATPQGVVFGGMRGELFGLHGEDFEAPILGTAILVELDLSGQVRWFTELQGHDTQIQLGGTSSNQPLGSVFGSFDGAMNVGGGTVYTESRRRLFLADLGEGGELGVKLVDLANLPFGAAVSAVASAPRADGSTIAVASVTHPGESERDVLLTHLPSPTTP